MEVVILCGGLGTRLSEKTQIRPKPMVEIGNRPMVWHIMKIYERFGISDFTLALGYKGEFIKDYFLNYHARSSNLQLNLRSGEVNYSETKIENWSLSLIDTGAKSLTGGRLLRLKDHLRSKGTFMLTYGDGLSDIDINSLLEFHRSHNKIATVSAVHPIARFGCLKIDNGKVFSFQEKSQIDVGLINGGFFVFEQEIFDYLEDDQTILETTPLEKLVQEGELMAYEHEGFWHCMDTLRDLNKLQEMWDSGQAPWVRS